jgi:adenine-specific DNA-methyltransferase
MSRLTNLIAQAKAKDADLGRELEREFRALSARRAFGLNFERHRPENVELPGRPIRKGDKVRVLPERGSTKKGDQRLWKVIGLAGKGAEGTAKLSLLYTDAPEQAEAPVADLCVVAEFRDYIYPGLVSTGKVERGGEKPFHTVINGENFHALEALTFTHRGKVDAIYIDPPYNSGATDWKYNNNYVEKDDLYRHSKWLAFMERRLNVAKILLKPENGVIVATIDKNEVANLTILLEQVFPEYDVTAVHIVHNPRGVQGDNFSFVHETALFVVPRKKKIIGPRALTPEEIEQNASPLRNWGTESQRHDAANCFYPIFVKDGKIISFGDDVTADDSIHPKHNEKISDDVIAVWPIDSKNVERKWRYARQSVEAIKDILVVRQLKAGAMKGDIEIDIVKEEAKQRTIWIDKKFDANLYGTQLVEDLVGTKFPFPKSLYAVEETIRTIVGERNDALVLDFFAGSGTTAHAVMRLNKQDGGKRQCISVTNNEVGADEHKGLMEEGRRPGDAEWEQWGICDYITKPRIRAAITGQTPEGEPIKGDYKFTDEFPMADGFAENAEFFTLTYETPVAVSHNSAFARIAPLLWMRAGSEGRRIDALPEAGWEVADSYGLLTELDGAGPFADAIAQSDKIRVAYIVTDDERRFQAIVRQLPGSVEPVRLYESYLTNFRFAMGR